MGQSSWKSEDTGMQHVESLETPQLQIVSRAVLVK